MNAVEKTEFAKSILFKTYDLETLKPFDQQRALKSLMFEIDELLELNNPTTLSKRNSWLKLPGTSDEDFMEKVFEIRNQHRVIAGIRHVGGNPNMPFINITLNFELSSWAEIEDIKNIVSSEFKVFKPRHLAVWLSPISSFTVELEGTVRPARRYLAGKTTDLMRMPLPLNFESFHIQPVKDIGYYQLYKSEYDLFHDKQPELKSWVTVSEFEDLEEYREQNLLFEAKMNEKTIGLIGGKSEPLLGMTGLYMGELLIAQDFKGRSLASAMQRKFIEKVGQNFEVVWGTIDARNIPSTKTAIRVGRHAVRTEYFIPII